MEFLPFLLSSFSLKACRDLSIPNSFAKTMKIALVFHKKPFVFDLNSQQCLEENDRQVGLCALVPNPSRILVVQPLRHAFAFFCFKMLLDHETILSPLHLTLLKSFSTVKPSQSSDSHLSRAFENSPVIPDSSKIIRKCIPMPDHQCRRIGGRVGSFVFDFLFPSAACRHSFGPRIGFDVRARDQKLQP